ncbi:RmlC-like cupin domain-containing protein [Jackrogersella minutella]|nr:RmlC-like cupin domain-containing protein [Jackrogersella minutella]
MMFNSAFFGPLGLLVATSIGTSAASLNHNSSIPIEHRSASEVVAQLNLIPNEEKGYYLQTFEDAGSVTTSNGTRSASTAIYYLLEGVVGPSYWHRVIDAPEVWHYYAGAPLALSLSNNDGKPPVVKLLGPDVFNNQQPQIVIPKGTWQSALSYGAWTLVGTTVAPGFVPASEELPPPGWHPNGV